MMTITLAKTPAMITPDHELLNGSMPDRDACGGSAGMTGVCVGSGVDVVVGKVDILDSVAKPISTVGDISAVISFTIST